VLEACHGKADESGGASMKAKIINVITTSTAPCVLS
jgi:hypothetical protein